MRKRKLKAISKATMFILFSALIFSLFFQFNCLAKEKNQMKNFTEEIKNISEENKKLEMSFLQENRMDKIEKIAQELDFEKIEKIHYIKVLEGTVVSR